MEKSPSTSGLWTSWRIFKDRTEGVRNKPPQGVFLRPVDYFEPKAIKTLHTRLMYMVCEMERVGQMERVAWEHTH